MHDKLQEIKTPTFRESEMHHCWCCTPPRRTVRLYLPEGRVRFFCKNSNQVMTQIVTKCILGPKCPNGPHCSGHENFIQSHGIYM